MSRITIASLTSKCASLEALNVAAEARVKELETKLARANDLVVQYVHKENAKSESAHRGREYLKANNKSSADNAPARTNPGVVARAEGESNADYVKRMKAQRAAGAVA